MRFTSGSPKLAFRIYLCMPPLATVNKVHLHAGAGPAGIGGAVVLPGSAAAVLLVMLLPRAFDSWACLHSMPAADVIITFLAFALYPPWRTDRQPASASGGREGASVSHFFRNLLMLREMTLRAPSSAAAAPKRTRRCCRTQKGRGGEPPRPPRSGISIHRGADGLDRGTAAGEGRAFQSENEDTRMFQPPPLRRKTRLLIILSGRRRAYRHRRAADAVPIKIL